MSSDGQVAISVKNISKCFEMYAKPVHRLFQTFFMGHKQFYKEFWALRDISFEVRKGECVGIVGRNGAGKSTLLQIITGTLAPTTGEVHVDGRVAALLELGSGFNPEFTGRENVYLNASILGLSRAEIDARFDDILAFADIGEFIDQPVKTYSSGMFVRLAFAVQVATEPDILIVDEALSVGDLAYQNKCIRRIHELQEAGTTIFFCSHDISTVQRICSSAIWIDGGRIREQGDPVEVCTDYSVSLTGGTPRMATPSSPAPGVVETQQRTGYAHFTLLEVDRKSYAPRQPMEIRYEFEAEQPLKPSCFGLSIYNQENVWLIGQCSNDDHCALVPLQPGERHAGTIRIPELRLAAGDYTLYLGIHSQDYLDYYVLNSTPVKFSVRNVNPTWGCLTIPIDWNTDETNKRHVS